LEPAGATTFGLPDAHTTKIVEIGSLGDCLFLSSPNEGDGMYRIRGIDRGVDEVVARTGEAVIKGGPAKWLNEGAPEPMGYPFPQR
jgi:hypothetical protein